MKQENTLIGKVRLSGNTAKNDNGPKKSYTKLANDEEQSKVFQNQTNLKLLQKNESLDERLHDDENADKQTSFKNTESPNLHSKINIISNVKVPELPKRITIVSYNDQGCSMVVQKLSPVLRFNEYYFTLVKDVVGKNAERVVTATVTDEQGSQVAEVKLPQEKIGQLYETCIVETISEITGSRQLVLSVSNERSQTMPLCSLKPVADSVNDGKQSNTNEANNYNGF